MIPYGRHWIEEDDIQAVANAMRGELLTQGPRATELEGAIAQKTGARYAVVCANGTAALHLACVAAGIGPGDLVATTPITFLASANCALYVGARPVFVDIDADTINLDPVALETAIACHPRIRAVIPVHFGGLPCDMVAIASHARRAGAVVIEDASHALGATYADGSPVGNCRYSDMTVFSFHPVKLVAAGEGGAITTNDESLYRKLVLLRVHGMTRASGEFQYRDRARCGEHTNPWYYEMQALGFNYRITEMQCALALSQFRKIDRFLARRRNIAQRYDAAFTDLPCLKLPQKAYRVRSANHLYVLRLDFGRLKLTRAHMMNLLRARGIGSQVHYIPVPEQPYYRTHGFGRGSWPRARAYYDEALTIPLYHGMTDEQVAYVIATISEIISDSLRPAKMRPERA